MFSKISLSMTSVSAVLRTVSVTAAALTCAHAATSTRTFSDNSTLPSLSSSQISGSTKSTPVSIPRWYRWLVSPSDIHLSPNDSADYNATESTTGLKPPEEKPGKVLAWGGVFGRSPTHLSSLGDRIMCVAAGANGLGAAVDADGRALLFAHTSLSTSTKSTQKDTTSSSSSSSSKTDAEHTSKVSFSGPVVVPLPTRAKRVIWRDAHDEAVFIDVWGDVYVARVASCDLNGVKQINGNAQRVDLLPGRRFKRRGRAKKISCGNSRCIALCSDGTTYSLENAAENVESNDSEKSTIISKPLQLPSTAAKFVDVACSDTHTTLLDASGILHTLGNDNWAQLGQNAMPWIKNESSNHAALKENQSPIGRAELFGDLVGTAVAVGEFHTAMLVRDGTLFTCGFNQFGQLGHHNYTTFAPPSSVADVTLRALAIAAGGNHTCVVTAPGGVLKCAGANESGQLGNGTLQPSQTWRKVRYAGKAVRPCYLCVGSGTTMAIVASDESQSSQKDKLKEK